MTKITTVLFDFDGVVADTEPLYDLFWEKVARKYQITIPNFPSVIKGTTLQHIFATYFAGYPQEEIEKITRASAEYELNMDFPEIPGSIDFLRLLKKDGYRLGLVTSSSSAKMEVALNKMGIAAVFDTIVTADRITHGKPDPMGYLTAAKDLSSPVKECVVLEDSFSGIQAGISAGMLVVGLSTTNPVESIRHKVDMVIPDFQNTDQLMEFIVKADPHKDLTN